MHHPPLLAHQIRGDVRHALRLDITCGAGQMVPPIRLCNTRPREAPGEALRAGTILKAGARERPAPPATSSTPMVRIHHG